MENNFKTSMLYLARLLEEQGKYDLAKMLMFIAAIDYSKPLDEIQELLKRYALSLAEKNQGNPEDPMK
ncbi:MAG: hypothetical protein JSW07_14700 [bacterium]|nr:MAG: hypothetical protein JSW07_14700 [bacterium]